MFHVLSLTLGYFTPMSSPAAPGLTLVPPSGPASTMGRRLPVDGTVVVDAVLVPPPSSTPSAPAGSAAPTPTPADCFSNVYSHRPINGPLPVQWYGAAAHALQPPAPHPRPMRGPSLPPVLRWLTRLQSGTI